MKTGLVCRCYRCNNYFPYKSETWSEMVCWKCGKNDDIQVILEEDVPKGEKIHGIRTV